MSEDIAHSTIAQSYLQMPYNQYVWLRKEFMCLCGDQLEAMIMRIVEYEIEGDRRTWLRKATELAEQRKPVPEEPEWWITLSHKQIATRLYDAVKSEKTIIAKLRSLTQKQFLLTRLNPNNPYGSPQYTINRKLVQEKLNELPALPSIRDAAKSQVTHPTDMTPPSKNIPSPQTLGVGANVGGHLPPKMDGGSPQTLGEPPSKNGGTNKKKEETLKQKEREQLPTSQPATESLSLSPVSNSLLESLTEEESTFWSRWCAISGSEHNSLNQNGYKHVKTLAEKSLTTDDLQSLYDAAYARIREFSQASGKEAIPPRLGNLINALPEWEKTRSLKKRDQELEQKQREHVSGTGNVRNLTQERLSGKAEPVIYAAPSVEKKSTLPTGISPSQMLEELRARRRIQQEV